MSERQAKRKRESANRPKTCFMCDAVAKRTEEHAMPSWLTEALDPVFFQNGGRDAFWGSSAGGGVPGLFRPGAPKNKEKRSSRNVAYLGPCKPCNTQWMSQIEKRLDWVKQLILAGRRAGPIPHGAVVARDKRSSLSAVVDMIDEQRGRDLTLWSLLRCVITVLAFHDAGRQRFSDSQLQTIRAMRDNVRSGLIPSTVTAEFIGPAGPARPLQHGVLFIQNHFVFAIKIGQAWIRIVHTDPACQFVLVRLALLGDVIHPWGGESALPAQAKLDDLFLPGRDQELRFLLNGVVPMPKTESRPPPSIITLQEYGRRVMACERALEHSMAALQTKRA